MLFTVKRSLALFYLDDIVLFSETTEKHTSHVQHVLTLLNTASAPYKFKTCSFFTCTTDCLGHVIWSLRLELASHKTDAVRGLKAPHHQRNSDRSSVYSINSIALSRILRDLRPRSTGAYKKINQSHFGLSTQRNRQQCTRWECL